MAGSPYLSEELSVVSKQFDGHVAEAGVAGFNKQFLDVWLILSFKSTMLMIQVCTVPTCIRTLGSGV